MEENNLEIEKAVQKPKKKGKIVLGIISILLAALTVLFGVLAFLNATSDSRDWYVANYSEARAAVIEAEESMERFEKLVDEFERETGIPYKVYKPKEYYAYLEVYEQTIQTCENLADTCWEKLQAYNMRTTVFGVLSAVCLVGAIVIFILFLKKKKKVPSIELPKTERDEDQSPTQQNI